VILYNQKTKNADDKKFTVWLDISKQAFVNLAIGYECLVHIFQVKVGIFALFSA